MPRWLLFAFGVALFGLIGGVAVYRISQRGIDRIKKHEQFRAEPYLDQTGRPTIGWGHLIQPGEKFTRITMAQGEEILRKDLARAEAAINRLVKVPLTESQYDALVSLVFNIGVGAFEFGGAGGGPSTVLRKLNAGDYAGAADGFLLWNKITDPATKQKVKSDGLAVRRQAERELFIA